ncbi:hypothetical protein SEA_BRAXOADDIE_92 [Rhodococcus phage Braxoaddie]|nr:hypothetical protein SEA_BRAXOADDIE_92 [Rhodococcus phage Braxoaddie]
MAQNARAALADIASANGWTVRRGETIGDGDTYTREGVTLTAYYTRSGSVLAATHDTGASVDRLTRDYGGKRETVAQWLAVPLASTGAPAHVAYPHANGTLYDCAGCESVCYCATLDALTDDSVRNDYDVSMCVRCAVLAETLADTNAVDGPVVRFVHWWNVRGRVALLDDVRSEAREGSGWGETVERVASVRWTNAVTATTLDDYDTVGEAISAGTVEIGDDGRAYAARATDYARLAIGASTDPAPVSAAPDDDTDPDDDGEPVSRCVACGEVIDYCTGHGEIGDPDGARIIDAHDNDDHTGCVPDPDACEYAADAARAAETMARVTGSVSATHSETRRDPLTGDVWVTARVKWDRVTGAVPVPSWEVSPSGVEYVHSDASDPDRDTASGYARPVTHYVAVIIDRNGAPVDYAMSWEAGQTYANDGYRVVALADDGHMSRADAQRLYDAERARALDCFGNDYAK